MDTVWFVFTALTSTSTRGHSAERCCEESHSMLRVARRLCSRKNDVQLMCPSVRTISARRPGAPPWIPCKEPTNRRDFRDLQGPTCGTCQRARERGKYPRRVVSSRHVNDTCRVLRRKDHRAHSSARQISISSPAPKGASTQLSSRGPREPLPSLPPKSKSKEACRYSRVNVRNCKLTNSYLSPLRTERRTGAFAICSS